MSRSIFDAKVDKLRTLVRTQPMDTYSFTLELQRVVAQLKESHTRVWLNPTSQIDGYAPILFQWLQDGYYIMAVQKEFDQYIGYKLVGINDTTTEKVTSLLKPFISSENPRDYTLSIPSMLISLALLKHLKIVSEDTSEIIYQTKEHNAHQQKIKLHTYPWKNRPDMSSRSHEFAHNPFFRSKCPYCIELRTDEKALIIHYTSCHDYEEHPLSTLNEEVNKALQFMNPLKIIIDLRNNQGGDSSLFSPILKILKTYRRKRPQTKFFVLVNESVFSSGIINAYETRDSLNAKVLGTTPLQRPNHYGEVKELALPKSKIVVQYSTKYFRYTKDDTEEFIPNQKVELSVRDYLNGTDAVIEEALL